MCETPACEVPLRRRVLPQALSIPVHTPVRGPGSADRRGLIKPAEPDRALLHRQAAAAQPLVQQVLHCLQASLLLLQLHKLALGERLPPHRGMRAHREAEEELAALAQREPSLLPT